jgi:hypothetical protein
MDSTADVLKKMFFLQIARHTPQRQYILYTSINAAKIMEVPAGGLYDGFDKKNLLY